MEQSLLKQVYELKEQIAILSTYLYMSVANSGLLGSLEQITTLTATVEALKVDVDAAEAEIVNLVAGQGTLITDVSNLTTTVTSVNSQVQLLNSGDMTITGQKTFDDTTIFNGNNDHSGNNTFSGNNNLTGANTIGSSGVNTIITGDNLIVPSSQGQNVFSATNGLRMNTGGGAYSSGNEPVAQFGSNISMINNKRIIWYYNWSIWGSSGGTFNFFYGSNPEGATTGVASIGTNGAYTQISDISKKTNVTPITYGLDTINRLRPVNFVYKTNLQDKQVGFIAQEVISVLPEAIQKHKDEEELMFIDKSSIIPVLVKAIQELTNRIKALESV